MSYILNALRKSEQERQAGEVPSLANSFTEHQIKTKRWISWLFIALVIIILILITFIWLNWQAPQVQSKKTDTKSEQVHPKKVSAATPDMPVKEPLLTSPVKTANLNHPIQPIAEKPKPSISKIVQKKHQKRIKQQESSTPKETDIQQAAPASSAFQKQAEITKAPRPNTVASIAKKSSPPGTTTDTENKMDEPAVETIKTEKPLSETAHIEPPLAEESEADTPKLSELPLEFRRRVPHLNINVFVYADDPKDRFVIIDMIKYTPNAQIAEDMELVQILNDSLVVDFRGKTFRIMRP
jgi:general secretion pathway protein B